MNILVAEDSPEIQFTLQTVLEQAGHECTLVSSGKEALEYLHACEKNSSVLPDVLLSDISMPGMGGFELLEHIRRQKSFSKIPVIFLSSRSELEDIREGLRLGASDYILKPFAAQELLCRIETLHGGLAERKPRLAQTFVGKSEAMNQVFELLDKIAPSEAPVLITGESGTGKELVARAIHEQGARASGPFVALNCSAFHEELLASELFGHVKGAFTGAHKDKKGLFEVADTGTLFLDELGEMPLSMQAKLLRVLQDGSFTPVGSTEEQKSSARIIAATNRDLSEMIAEGKFREDLYYRVQVLHIELPPLRERVGDIEHIAQAILEKLARRYDKKTLSDEARRVLVGYSWPGNVRELENELERAVIVAGLDGLLRPAYFSRKLFVDPNRLPNLGSARDEQLLIESLAELYAGKSLQLPIQTLERACIAQSLQRHGGNKSQAAKELDISRSSLIAKAKAYALSTDGEEE